LIHQLSERCRILAIDLPGHGFSSVPRFGRSTLEAITDGVAHLLNQLDIVPTHIVGHSAGAAIAVQLGARTHVKTPVTCINAAFGNFSGMAGIMFPYIAKLAANDKTVPSSVSQEWAKRIASAEFIAFGGYGHLIHEETPETIAPLITRGL
jgi:magnesium chelatase accessory protein